MKQESLFVQLAPGAVNLETLHLRHIYNDTQPLGPPVVLLHGAVENGRIFYTENGKGFGPLLAGAGFDVYVADFRGRGQSTPAISAASEHGQTDTIVSELPTLAAWVRRRRGADKPISWVTHSWGGVLLLAFLARFPEEAKKAGPMVFFGTKRSVHVQTPEKWLKIDFAWHFLAPLVTWLWGYLPAKAMRMGSDNETRLSHSQSVAWVKRGPWVDPGDGFDYATAIRKIELPPGLWIAGEKDYSLGHPRDVRALIAETGAVNQELRLVPFGHVGMLVDSRAYAGYLPEVVAWLRDHSAPRTP